MPLPQAGVHEVQGDQAVNLQSFSGSQASVLHSSTACRGMAVQVPSPIAGVFSLRQRLFWPPWHDAVHWLHGDQSSSSQGLSVWEALTHPWSSLVLPVQGEPLPEA